MATMKRNDRLDRYFDGIEMEKWLPTIGYDEDSEDDVEKDNDLRAEELDAVICAARKEAQGWA